jgi:predicted RNA-binding protein YlxR (DUF448 family)
VSEVIRTCVGCGRKAPQDELFRFASVDGTLTFDAARRLPGRGAYTCRQLSCFERAVSRRAFARTLRRTVEAPDSLKALYERR